MHPYFFGDSDRQLYGVYDPPRSHSHNDEGVLLCYPMGQEYMRSHWASRQLVNQLCRAGMHCMRFDYYGTGDSAGTVADTDLRQWQSDVNTAIREFKDISGISRISLVGLRFGAALAATVPSSAQKIEKLVLWDPVVSGTTYINNLRNMHAAYLDKARHLHPNRAAGKLADMEELLGFRFSDKLIAEIEAVKLLNTNQFSAAKIFLVVSEQQQEYEQLKEHLRALGLLKGHHVTTSSGEWDNMREFANALIASEAIGIITRELTSR